MRSATLRQELIQGDGLLPVVLTGRGRCLGDKRPTGNASATGHQAGSDSDSRRRVRTEPPGRARRGCMKSGFCDAVRTYEVVTGCLNICSCRASSGPRAAASFGRALTLAHASRGPRKNLCPTSPVRLDEPAFSRAAVAGSADPGRRSPASRPPGHLVPVVCPGHGRAPPARVSPVHQHAVVESAESLRASCC